MTYWSDLYAGDAELIGQAFAGGEIAEDVPFVEAHVHLPEILPDFSLQTCNSPDFLTEVASAVLGGERVSFKDSMLTPLVGDPDPTQTPRGAVVVSPRWVDLFKRITKAQAREVAISWLKEWEPNTPADSERVFNVAHLVFTIVDLCRRAHSDHLSVVFAWTL